MLTLAASSVAGAFLQAAGAPSTSSYSRAGLLTCAVDTAAPESEAEIELASAELLPPKPPPTADAVTLPKDECTTEFASPQLPFTTTRLFEGARP